MRMRSRLRDKASVGRAGGRGYESAGIGAPEIDAMCLESATVRGSQLPASGLQRAKWTGMRREAGVHLKRQWPTTDITPARARKVRSVVAGIARVPVGRVFDGSRLTEDLGIGSVQRVELTALLEVELDAGISDATVSGAKTVRDLISALTSSA